jgi:cobalamin biosynthesis protein CbiD
MDPHSLQPPARCRRRREGDQRWWTTGAAAAAAAAALGLFSDLREYSPDEVVVPSLARAGSARRI